MIKNILAFLLLFSMVACGNKLVPNSSKQFLSAEDEAVLELLTEIKKKPGDKSLLELMPATYQRAMDSRAAMEGYVLRDNPPGDRWVLWRRQLEASQSITDAVLAIPQASAMIKEPVQFRDQISKARVNAAEEYYQGGTDLLKTENRLDARLALEMFQKARKEVPDYKDIATQIRRAEELATLYVVVNPVDYNGFGWNYWGYQNDYLQWQMLRDLNNRSYKLTRFLTEQEARSMRIRPERVVDMRFARLQVSNPYTERDSYQREKQIPVPNPKKDSLGRPLPSVETITVRATITFTRRFINGDADLECRIYDINSGRNILYDHFPGRYNWVFETATYTGDQRALTDDDLRKLNNRFDQYPTREEVGQKLVNDAYSTLVRRIEQGVNFDNY
jgi:hypothetical protein